MLKVPVAEVSVQRRGFRVSDPAVGTALEHIGREFLAGYHLALEEGGMAALGRRLDAGTALHFRGFAFEGAAMALTLLDHLTPRRGGRFERLLSGYGNPHFYMCHVGAGWAVARLPWLRLRIEPTLEHFHPMGRWLVMDGYGFHEGFFHLKRSVERMERPSGLGGYPARAFDQGLGRSLWFVDGTNASRIPRTIGAFSPARHSDLWSGVGLACAYAGGADESAVQILMASAGSHQAAFSQGVAFAAKARQRAGNPAHHTENACRIACGMSAEEAAALADETEKGAGDYEVWRQRLQLELTGVRR